MNNTNNNGGINFFQHYYESPTEISNSCEEDPFTEKYARLEVKENSQVGPILRKITHHFNTEDGDPTIVLYGLGNSIPKLVDCVEQLKNFHFKGRKNGIFQINRLKRVNTSEIWEPRQDNNINELDRIKVSRTVPILYILLSNRPICDNFKNTEEIIQFTSPVSTNNPVTINGYQETKYMDGKKAKGPIVQICDDNNYHENENSANNGDFH